jgi:hypothetical protein
MSDKTQHGYYSQACLKALHMYRMQVHVGISSLNLHEMELEFPDKMTVSWLTLHVW